MILAGSRGSAEMHRNKEANEVCYICATQLFPQMGRNAQPANPTNWKETPQVNRSAQNRPSPGLLISCASS